MRYLRFVPVCVLALAVLAGCGDDSSSTGALTGSSTSTSPTTGSGTSAPGAGSATLRWAEPTSNTNGTPLTNLAGFHIYYGTSPSNLTSNVQIANAAAMGYTINNLPAGTWYFSINAYTSAGVESAVSNIASKTIP